MANSGNNGTECQITHDGVIPFLIRHGGRIGDVVQEHLAFRACVRATRACILLNEDRMSKG